MATPYSLEALLRPPVEIWSALSAFSVAIVAAWMPWFMFMTPSVGYATAGILAVMGVIRARKAYTLIRYQRNIRRLRRYKLKQKAVPVSKTRLFLGRGFEWTQTHTQRLHDTKSQKARKYVAQSAFYIWIRRAEVKWENYSFLAPLTAITQRDGWYNPVRPLPPVGGKPQIHGVEPNENDVLMDLRERVGHTLVLGTTRVGKTRFAEVLLTQDIARGDVVIVIDPKGDAGLMKRVIAESKRAGRENETYVFHLGYPEISCRYNSIGNFGRITEIASRVTNPLPSEGNSAAFREFAWRFTNMIAMALVKMGRRPDYTQITRHIGKIEPLLLEYYRYWLTDAGPEGWKEAVKRIMEGINERDLPFALKGRNHEAIALIRYIKENERYDPVVDGLRSAFEYDKTYFDKIVASLLPLMEKLVSGKIAQLLSPDYADTEDHRPIIDWQEIIRRKGVVYIGLDALADTTVAGAVGNTMFADLVSVSAGIYKYGIDHGMPDKNKSKDLPVISLHCDEFNELIGDEFIPLLNKAGGSGFQVTAYTQTWSDIEARADR